MAGIVDSRNAFFFTFREMVTLQNGQKGHTANPSLCITKALISPSFDIPIINILTSLDYHLQD